ncbi:MAG: class I SAM-dependent methyltransferase, partial [Bacilli bacterium]
MSEKPKLEIGPGWTPNEGYLTLDIRHLPHIDHVLDASKPLPFPDGSFSRVLACHVLEHFSHAQTRAILKEWGRILEPGGEIEIHCPDLEWAFRNYATGNISFGVAVLNIFGAQEYEYDYHKTGFDLLTLSIFLADAGFKDVRRLNQPMDDDGWQLKVVATREHVIKSSA